MKSYETSKGILSGLLGAVISSFIAMMSTTPEVLSKPILILTPVILFLYFRKSKYSCLGVIIAYLIVVFFTWFAFTVYPPAHSIPF